MSTTELELSLFEQTKIVSEYEYHCPRCTKGRIHAFLIPGQGSLSLFEECNNKYCGFKPLGSPVEITDVVDLSELN
jgi:hypothetical protein